MREAFYRYQLWCLLHLRICAKVHSVTENSSLSPELMVLHEAWIMQMPKSRILLVRLIVTYLFKKFPEF
jgi:hypothetical protein